MIAIDPAEAGGPEVLQPVERPVPAAGRRRSADPGRGGGGQPARRACSACGLYPPPPGAPSIPGLEVAGEIVAAGEGADPARIGEQVCALVAGGGYANIAPRPAGQCLPVPGALSMVEAAAMPETLLHRLDQPLPARRREGGRHRAGPWRHQRHRHDGDPARQAVRPDRHRHRRLGGEMRAARCEIGAAHAIDYKAEDFVARGEETHRRPRRRHRPRHGRRRLSAAQPRTASPRRAATSRSRSSAAPRRKSRSGR